MVPMRKRGHDQTIDVGEDLLHGLALRRRRRGKLRFQIARLNLRKHRQLIDPFKVITNPIDQLMTKAAKVFPAHVSGGRSKSFCFSGGWFHDAESSLECFEFRVLDSEFCLSDPMLQTRSKSLVTISQSMLLPALLTIRWWD